MKCTPLCEACVYVNGEELSPVRTSTMGSFLWHKWVCGNQASRARDREKLTEKEGGDWKERRRLAKVETTATALPPCLAQYP